MYSNKCYEEFEKIDRFLEILNKSGIETIIENEQKKGNKFDLGRKGYNPYNLMATVIYCFSNFKSSLREIEKFIPNGSILADIGCDHAYLDCLAIHNNKCIKCYACDIAQGPLEMAKKTIHEMGCENKVFPILSNGLENVPNDANVCVISGMGFETIKMILEGKDLSQFDRFILQANNDVYDLRKWVILNGYKIIDESMVHEGHYYTILVVEKGMDSYTEEDYIFGKFLNNDVFKQYWIFRKERLENIIPNLNDENQIKEFKTLLNFIKQRTE